MSTSSGPADRPADPGLQSERTALSWQRSALAIAVGSLFYARLVSSHLGGWSALPAVAGLLLAAFMGLKSRRRYEHHHRTLTARRGAIADGLLPAVVAASVAAAGVFALVVLIASL